MTRCKYICKNTNIRCRSSASFNIEDQKTPKFCKTHIPPNIIMINVRNNIRCIHVDKETNKQCVINAAFNYKGESLRLYCNMHKLPNMINILNKRCEFTNVNKRCNITAKFNYSGNKIGRFCNMHKLKDMVNIYAEKCKECKIKQSVYNYKNEKQGLYCRDCKKENMIDVISKKCIECKIKRPYFNYKNEKQGLYCGDCKKENMINVINKKCIECDLFYVKKINNYLCSYCNPEKSKRVKTKEIEVKELLELNNIQFIHDKKISNKCCYKYRPDFIIDCLYYYLIVEVDEDGHSNYDRECELIRMNNIQLSLELPTKFIRYNPDKKGIKKNVKKKELLEKVKEWMKKDINELKTEEPVYLFY